MLELSKGNRHILEQLHYSKEEVCIEACIEGIMGSAWLDNLEAPSYGLVAVADFCFLLIAQIRLKGGQKVNDLGY